MISWPTHLPSRHAPRRQRGSVLIVAMLFSAIMAVSLTSYLTLSTSTLRVANRTFHNTTALNAAEAGLELGLWSFNKTDSLGLATAWAGWTLDAAAHTATRTFTLDTGRTVTVRVQGYDGSIASPKVVAKAVINAGDGGPEIHKYLEVTLTRRSLFANGLVAKNSVSWVGHPEADSWDSDPDNDPSTPAVAYAVGLRTAECTVGCVDGSISLGSGGNVYGYTATGASGSTSGGSVHGLGTTVNDPTRISTDFSATFPAVTVPSPATAYAIYSGSEPIAFPRGGDTAATDGRYYYVFGTGAAISKSTTISDDVTFIMTNHSGVQAIGFTGTKQLTINANASVVVYTDGDIRAFGNGIVNNNQAKNFILYGTNTTAAGQTIGIGGNGQLTATIYAPNADIELKGGGSSGQVSGSIVGRTINMNGGTNFHYDVALSRLNGGNPYGISAWKELQSAAERAPYLSL